MSKPPLLWKGDSSAPRVLDPLFRFRRKHYEYSCNDRTDCSTNACQSQKYRYRVFALLSDGDARRSPYANYREQNPGKRTFISVWFRCQHDLARIVYCCNSALLQLV